eukprot:jgi/Bigna1/70807/fgenesh1_pg.13_\
MARDEEDEKAAFIPNEDEAPCKDFPVAYFYLCPVVVSGALPSLIRGYDLGIVGAALLPTKRHFDLSEVQMQLLVAMVMPIAAAGSLIAGSIADRVTFTPHRRHISAVMKTTVNLLCQFGRKLGLLLATVVIGVALITMGAAESFDTLLAGRCIAAKFVRMYFDNNNSSSLLLLWQLTHRRGGGGLRLFEYVVAVLCGLAILLLMLIPDSPRWLMAQGRKAEATSVLHNTVSTSAEEPAREAIAAQRLAEIRKDMEMSKTQRVATWSELFYSSENTENLKTGLVFAALCPLVGVEAVFLYIVYSLDIFGVSEKDGTNIVGIVMGLLHLLGNVFTTSVIDNPKFGRRGPLLAGALGIVTSVILISLFGFSKGSIPKMMVIITFCMYATSYGLGYGSLSLTIVAEIFTGPFRSKGLALCGVLSRVCGFLVTIGYITLVETLEIGGVYLILTFISLGGYAFCYMRIPELQGKTIGHRAEEESQKTS